MFVSTDANMIEVNPLILTKEEKIVCLDAKVNLTNAKSVSVILDKPEYGISPGQACVFYKSNEYGDRCLGGGWIS